MWEDPIVKEVREIRDQLAAEYDYDVRKLCRYLQECERQEHRKIISMPSRRPEPWQIKKVKDMRPSKP
ncbi:MAG: hypothetical protein V3T17_11350 [Pseudomonadales bacterium]